MSVQRAVPTYREQPIYPQRGPYPTGNNRDPYHRSFKELTGLEKDFSKICFQEIVRKKCDFPTYLKPNEEYPLDGIPHYQHPELEEGFAVATGSERLLFLLCLLDPQKCKGMVGRDIHSDTLFYNLFNLLLIRLSADRKKYKELSSSPGDQREFDNKMTLIIGMVRTACLPDIVRLYYLEHLREFASIYFGEPKEWREKSSFDRCNYYKCDALFEKIKSYADDGNIIFTEGDINNLTFLEGKKISLIDVSNIPDYCFLDFKGLGDSHPRVVRTQLVRPYTKKRFWVYQSYIHQPLSQQERSEFDVLLKTIKVSTPILSTKGHADPYTLWMLTIPKPCQDFLDADLGGIYSKKTLKFLREYVANNILNIPAFGDINISIDDITNLNNLYNLEIEEICREKKRTKLFIMNLVQAWDVLNPSIYLAFSELEQWNEVFEAYFLSRPDELDRLLTKIRDSGLFETLEQRFGKDRLAALMRSVAYDAFMGVVRQDATLRWHQQPNS